MAEKRTSLATEKEAIFAGYCCSGWNLEEYERFRIKAGTFFDLVSEKDRLYVEFDGERQEVYAYEIVAKILDHEISKVVFYNRVDFLGGH